MKKEWDAELDATGLLCPLPVLKARSRMRQLKPGQVLRILADDPAAIIDFPHFCADQGHELKDSRTTRMPFVFHIAKG
ncbi:MAG: sulfurtransferase TusA family protein [Paracoccaceae bacterium]|nr:sulfurtransferase TusA family protein [Paracoccaceae bacterium]MDE2914833.1 sulfurtransferase TusA family protein [Paracoccaceae bacterium]